MTKTEPTVFVVDDDVAVRDSLVELVESTDLRVESYASAEEFLDCCDCSRPGCLVLDVCMPGIGGLELQERLRAEQIDIPVIIITGHGDVKMASRCFKLGVVDFFEKPFNDEQLLDCIRVAIEKDAQARRQKDRRKEVESRLSLLSARERQILDLVLAGRLNKQIAAELGITQRTVEDHRAHIMGKMKANSLPELVRLASDGGL